MLCALFARVVVTLTPRCRYKLQNPNGVGLPQLHVKDANGALVWVGTVRFMRALSLFACIRSPSLTLACRIVCYLLLANFIAQFAEIEELEESGLFEKLLLSNEIPAGYQLPAGAKSV